MNWTEKEIIKALDEMVRTTKQDTMPTHSEITAFYGNCCLTNAVRRHGGTKYYANLLGLKIKDCESKIGEVYENKFIFDLHSKLNLSGEQTIPRYPYDVLVENCTKIDVKVENDTVWLSLEQMAELFQRNKSTISRHIKNIFEEGELNREVVVVKYATTTQHGAIEGKQQTHWVDYYNLDVIISVGYRVKSVRGTQFRIWATQRLKEYLVKGFTMDDERLKGNGGGNYWKELLDRIRDIRSSEKVLYRQVLDLYATSVDYNPRSDESILFFKMVQNKLHFAAHGHTAAEVIYERADAEKPFMGLTAFSGELPALKDIGIAKNYLNESELKILNNLVSGYFDLAEISAIEHKPMYMSDYIQQLDAVLTSGNRPLLEGAGSVSHTQAIEKARTEYRKYQANTLSPVEHAYLDTIKTTAKTVKRQRRGKDKNNE